MLELALAVNVSWGTVGQVADHGVGVTSKHQYEAIQY